jgi:cell division protein FtsB
MAQLEEENQRLKAEIERLKKRLEAIEGQGEPRKT